MSILKRPRYRMGKSDSISNLNGSSMTSPINSTLSGMSTNPDRAKNELSGLVFRIEENEEVKTIGQPERRKLTSVANTSPRRTSASYPVPPGTALGKVKMVFDVAIIGAGPAGLVLALVFGLSAYID
jgi:hypothetical protein